MSEPKNPSPNPASEAVRLLVRVDDAGASHAANMGCLQACAEGIARSVEVMMPGAWITQAADLFHRHPEIDIGIHLTLTSEWDAVKWRPLTHAASLVDDTGAFLPLLVPREGRGVESLQARAWSLQEIADEFRAQIALGKKMFPQATHVSAHMIRHFADFDARLGDMIAELCDRFGLLDDPFGHGLPRFRGYPSTPVDTTFRTASFVEGVKGLTSGTHIFIDHPAIASPEAEALGHQGYETVQDDRLTCLETLTDPAVARCILENNIELISYGTLLESSRSIQ